MPGTLAALGLGLGDSTEGSSVLLLHLDKDAEAGEWDKNMGEETKAARREHAHPCCWPRAFHFFAVAIH